jgi:tetratricopeptide (TPR) repeat protein
LLSLGYRISAEIYQEAGDSKSAEDPFANALKFAREAQVVETASARGYVAEAEYWETRRNYEEALKLRNKSAPLCTKPEVITELYRYRWRLHFWLGGHSDALNDLKALTRLRDENDSMHPWDAGFFPALIEADRGDVPKAAGLVSNVAHANPSSFRAVTAAVCMLRMLRMDRQAESLLNDTRDKIKFEPRGAAEIEPDFIRVSIDILAGKLNPDALRDREGARREGRIGGALPGFFGGCMALGGGNRSEAFRLFRQCDGAYDAEDYCFLARAIVRKMEKDPAWPPWIAAK